MSIIQEALKRAQYDYAGKKNPQQAREDLGPKPAVPSAHAEAFDLRMITKKIGIIVYVIVLLALVTGFGIRALFLKVANMGKSKDMVAAAQKAVPDKPTIPTPLPSGAVEKATEKILAMVSSSGAANQAPNLVLNGIMYIAQNPKAIINGTVVRVGDVVDGATVTSITESNVLLKYNNNDNQIEMALKLKE